MLKKKRKKKRGKTNKNTETDRQTGTCRCDRPGLVAVDVTLGLLTVETQVVPDTQVLPHAAATAEAVQLHT